MKYMHISVEDNSAFSLNPNSCLSVSLLIKTSDQIK